MSGESLESLLEFLTISGRVAVVQLEPPRARSFAEALRLAMEFGEARAAKLMAERDEWKAACLRAREVEEALTGVGPLADVAGAVAAEREACATSCDEAEAGFKAQSQAAASAHDAWTLKQASDAAHHLAAVIRARGAK